MSIVGFSKALFFDSQKLPKAFDAWSPEQQHIMTDPAARDHVEAKVDPKRIQRIAAHLQRQLVGDQIVYSELLYQLIRGFSCSI